MFCNIYRVFVACGVLIMPYGISLSGIGPSFLLIFVISLLTTINHSILKKVCNKLGIPAGVTLETLCGKIYGSKMEKFILIIIAGSQLAAFIGSFILATELFHHSLCGSYSSDLECISRTSVASYMAIFNIIMVLIPNLKTFGYISSLSVFFQFFALLSIFYYASKMLFQRDNLSSLLLEELFFSNWGNSLQTLGIILYIFQRITFYLPIHSNYSQMPNFHSFYLRSMNFIFAYIFIISTPCYFQFFSSSREIVFQNFKSSFHVIEFFKMAYCLVIFLSNPINLFPIYNSIFSIRSLNKRFQQQSRVKLYFSKLFFRLIITCIGIAFGIFITSFVSFCSFVGAFFFSFLGLVMPALLLCKVIKNEKIPKSFWENVKLYLCLLYTSPSPRDLSTSRMPSSA